MTEPALERGDALIVVDVQRDFPPGSALAVPLPYVTKGDGEDRLR